MIEFSNRFDKVLYGYLILAIGIAAYVGSRMPSLWSINYYLPSFFEGFYRRGLLGTLLYPFGEFRFNYTFLSSIQITVLMLLLCCLLWYAYRAKTHQKMMLVLFFLAPTGGYFFHLMGYSDHLLYLLLIVALMTKRFPWIGLILMVASLFIHEAALFTTIPIYLVSLLMERGQIKWLVIHVLVLAITFILLTCFLQTVPLPTIEQFIAKLSQIFGPYARLEYYATFHNQYTTQAVQNTFYGLQNEIAPPPRGDYQFLYFEIVLVMIYAFFVARLFVNRTLHKGYQLFCYFAVWCACLMPLLLVFFGIDSFRWVFLAYASSVFLFCMSKEAPGNIHCLSVLFIYLIFLAHGHFWYFDGLTPRGFELSQLTAFWNSL